MKNLLKTKLFKPSFIIAFVAFSLLLTSCKDDGNDILQVDEMEEVEVEVVVEENKVTVTPTNADTDERSIEVVAEAKSLVEVKVSFTGDEKMSRIYMTKNVFSVDEGAQPYEYELGSKKRDGSIDLDGDDKDSFNFVFNFDAPSDVNDVVQYVIWATTGLGDFREISKRNSVADDAFAVITIKAGEAADLNFQSVANFSATILAAPLSDGTSETFVSIFNGEKYKIVQQNQTDINANFTDAQKAENSELSALWDFGYFYGATDKASFASASRYMEVFKGQNGPIVNITNFTGLEKADLNQCFFAKSTLSVANFDAATKTELEAIVQPTKEFINDLKVDDIVEFVDAYGNKGLIKIKRIKGTFNSGDEIEFDVKVQIKTQPIKG